MFSIEIHFPVCEARQAKWFWGKLCWHARNHAAYPCLEAKRHPHAYRPRQWWPLENWSGLKTNANFILMKGASFQSPRCLLAEAGYSADNNCILVEIRNEDRIFTTDFKFKAEGYMVDSCRDGEWFPDIFLILNLANLLSSQLELRIHHLPFYTRTLYQ